MKQRDVFVFVLCVLGLILAIMVFRSYGEEVRLEWDHVEGVDGYRLYQAIREIDPDTGVIGHTFDYDDPIKTDDFPDGNIPQETTTLTVDLPGRSGDDTKYMFTARSYLGNETSENSNEVSYVVSLVPPLPAAELSGGFVRESGVVTISWNQPPDEYEWRTISHWIVYYRITGAEEWVPIGRIKSDHVLEMTAPFDAVPTGEQSSVDFVIVSYRRSGVYSANSEVLTLDINRREVPPIQNLRISIEIPVI